MNKVLAFLLQIFLRASLSLVHLVTKAIKDHNAHKVFIEKGNRPTKFKLKIFREISSLRPIEDGQLCPFLSHNNSIMNE